MVFLLAELTVETMAVKTVEQTVEKWADLTVAKKVDY